MGRAPAASVRPYEQAGGVALLDAAIGEDIPEACSTCGLGPAVRENARRLAGRVLRAQEEERARVSRELHDETGQMLTLLLVRLRVMASTIADDRLRQDWLEAIRAVARGDAYLTPSAVRLLLSTQRAEREPSLSTREREVLRLTARGFSNVEIADRLFVSAKTVDTYRSRVMAKLDLHRRSALVDYALSHGLME